MVWGFQLWELRVCAILSQQVPEVVDSLSSQAFLSARIFVQRKARSVRGNAVQLGPLHGLSSALALSGATLRMLEASQANPRMGWENLLTALKI